MHSVNAHLRRGSARCKTCAGGHGRKHYRLRELVRHERSLHELVRHEQLFQRCPLTLYAARPEALRCSGTRNGRTICQPAMAYQKVNGPVSGRVVRQS